MSGGHFGYNQYQIGDIADEIERLIQSNADKTLNEWGDRKGLHFSDETIKKFRIAVRMLREAQIYAHRIDWLVSADDDEESFHQRLEEDLAKVQVVGDT